MFIIARRSQYESLKGFTLNRTTLTKLHLLLAAFMFPAVLMFLVTGALYTWGEKGAWHEQTAQITLEQPLAGQSEDALKGIAITALQERGIAAPSGKASLSGEGDDVSFAWTGARSDISITATADPLVANADIKEASFHRWLVQLHKAKGSTAFKVYATILAVILLLLVASGLIMGLQVKALRRLTVLSSVVGAVAFVGFVLVG